MPESPEFPFPINMRCITCITVPDSDSEDERSDTRTRLVSQQHKGRSTNLARSSNRSFDNAPRTAEFFDSDGVAYTPAKDGSSSEVHLPDSPSIRAAVAPTVMVVKVDVCDKAVRYEVVVTAFGVRNTCWRRGDELTDLATQLEDHPGFARSVRAWRRVPASWMVPEYRKNEDWLRKKKDLVTAFLRVVVRDTIALSVEGPRVDAVLVPVFDLLSLAACVPTEAAAGGARRHCSSSGRPNSTPNFHKHEAVPIDKLELLGVLGKGCFSQVLTAWHKKP